MRDLDAKIWNSVLQQTLTGKAIACYFPDRQIRCSCSRLKTVMLAFGIGGQKREAIRWAREVPRTANAPFIEKTTLAFLRDAPDAVLNRLFSRADAAARLSSHESRSSA
jgi:hypothetical protein